jgi:hypothetical protein
MRSNHSDLRGRRASGGEGERVIAGMVDSVLAEMAERLQRDAQASHSGPMLKSSDPLGSGIWEQARWLLVAERGKVLSIQPYVSRGSTTVTPNLSGDLGGRSGLSDLEQAMPHAAEQRVLGRSAAMSCMGRGLCEGWKRRTHFVAPERVGPASLRRSSHSCCCLHADP